MYLSQAVCLRIVRIEYSTCTFYFSIVKWFDQSFSFIIHERYTYKIENVLATYEYFITRPIHVQVIPIN